MGEQSPQEIKDLIFNNLKASRYFSSIDDEVLRKFLTLTEYLKPDDGEVVVKQGELNDHIYVLINGAASIKIDGNHIHDLKRKGDIFGEMSATTGQTSHLTVEAKESLELIMISSDLLKSIQDDPTHNLHHLFYKWTSSILYEKFFLTSQKAKLHEEAENALKDLLDNTGQGIFTFGRDYKIHPQYSKACEYFFDGPIEGKDALELMFAPPEPPMFSFTEEEETDDKEEENRPDAEAVRELIEMVFNGTGGFAILGDLLPRELRLVDLFDQVQILSLKYHLLQGNEGNDRVMITLTDVTKERELAEQMAIEAEKHAMIIKIALDKEGFIQSLREMESLFLSIYTLGTKRAAQIDPNELFRHYHTIKGGSASYGLKDIADEVQQIESTLEAIRSGQEKLTEPFLIKILKDTIHLQNSFANTLDSLSNIIPREEIQQNERLYKVKASRIKSIEKLLAEALPDEFQKQIRDIVGQLSKQPLSPIFKKYEMAAQGVADRLGKPVNIDIRGKDIEVYHERLEEVFTVLLHLVRNCVDHGLETVDTRTNLGKPNFGKITLEGRTQGHTLKLIISDDGAGIDPEVIKKIALQKEVVDEAFIASAPDDEIINLIFAPGFSTAEAVTNISGRGVGMDAVKVTIEKLGGRIDIKTKINEGTVFEVSIPHVA